ncbi:SixA phosphatase family protein [Pseudoclavibacter helvolus]|uniref:SixA phosphatase family protein n=1 Tax=Pseudoclavibacter helvolus TaxID=255205 RepID=UPI0024AD5203|nr:histidine phosphatase family protein [Pseudoclavibacter helvolus]
MPRTLIMLRHAKAEHPMTIDDRQRSLADRGVREAAEAGDWLRENAPKVDKVLCSPAARTRQTLETAEILAPAEFPSALYMGGEDDYLEQVKETDAEVQTLLVIGHEPTVSGTAIALAADKDSELALEIRHGYPTSGITVLTFHGEWDALRWNSANITAFRAPR